MTFGAKNPDEDTSQDRSQDPGAFYMGRMRPPPEPQRILPRGLLSIVVIIAFLGVIWYAYPQGEEKHRNTDVPVVTADRAAFKQGPDDPGGLVVPHQESTLFDSFEQTGGTEKAERLLPPQEEPLDRTTLGLNLEPAMATPPPATVTEPAAEEKTPEPVEEVKAVLPPAPVPASPVTEKPVAEKPAPEQKVTPADGVYIQLGSYSSGEKAKTGWAALQKQHSAQLSDKKMRTEKVDLGVKGVFHRLQAGPFAHADAAAKACDAVKKGGNGCFVVK